MDSNNLILETKENYSENKYTNKLVADAKARFSHNSAKYALKEKYENKLIIVEQCGLWKITPEIIGYLISLGETEETVLIDEYKDPKKINVSSLRDKFQKVYNEVMNEWYDEWNSLEGKR